MPWALLTALDMLPAKAKIKQIRAKNGAACGAIWAVYYYLDVYGLTLDCSSSSCCCWLEIEETRIRLTQLIEISWNGIQIKRKTNKNILQWLILQDSFAEI